MLACRAFANPTSEARQGSFGSGTVIFGLYRLKNLRSIEYFSLLVLWLSSSVDFQYRMICLFPIASNLGSPSLFIIFSNMLISRVICFFL